MHKIIYRIKCALATAFVAIISFAILRLAFENWYAGETSLVLRNSPMKVIELSDQPLFFYVVLGIYILLGLFFLVSALYLGYQAIFATPESMDRISRSSRFLFGKSDPGLLWVGGILIVAFIFLLLKSEFGF